jgi:Mrp family chromosome partitioning ATPase
MTRIFDALRKAEAFRGPRSSPAPVPAAPAPGGPGATYPAPVSMGRGGARPGMSGGPVVVPFASAPELPEDVVRAMTSLRVTLESALAERSPRIVMFLSSQAGEGTTTVATQFALTLARDERVRTLFMDAHARRPALGADPAQTAAIPRPLATGGPEVSLQNLDLLPVSDEQRAAGLMASNAVRETLEALGGHYDWVVMDGPPALESPDAAVLAALADGTVLVVQAGRTKRPVLARSAELLRKAGARVLGTVLNRRRLEIPAFIYRRI